MLAIGSLGVVFGDIGTSPLYAFRSALSTMEGEAVRRADVYGIVALALWALIMVVTVKYVLFLMRADNKGEGGVLSLMALAQRAIGRRTWIIFLLGLVGAALFYGDAVITPAISVLSAIEGLKTIPSVGHSVNTDLVVLISIAILLGLFFVQSRGTARVGALFGPIMLVWFCSMLGLGLTHILDDPRVLFSLNPGYGIEFLARHGFVGFLVLGSVFLTVTGAEALYADMGHFGRWPIQSAWLFMALPCLALNYLGQGAMALRALKLANAHGQGMPDLDWFFVMAPPELRLPLVILATVATIIASQAVITGAYSLSQQAIQLGLLPRMDVRRTSETQTGQIFLPQINSMLLTGVLLLVVMFQTSDNLSHAYGLAVTGTMLVTTSLAYLVVRHMWNWGPLRTAALIGPLVAMDLTFLAANALKFLSGGWVPVLIGLALALIMITWNRGTQLLFDKTRRDSVPMKDLADILKNRAPHRVAGTAVFLTSDPDVAPVALMHNLKHNKVLHEKNVILTVATAETPRVRDEDRLSIEPYPGDDFTKVTIKYGFMESPNLPKALALCRKQGLKFDIMATSFFLGRRSVVPAVQSGMPLWQDKLFIFLMKNATNPTDFFNIPPGRVVELGTQVTV
ncbi:MAG TPA: potassium transporter Kup [Caulobacteraceae bacterium]|nr:potassium transporter Kup [Caulobacteraceae bacterium]